MKEGIKHGYGFTNLFWKDGKLIHDGCIYDSAWQAMEAGRYIFGYEKTVSVTWEQ